MSLKHAGSRYRDHGLFADGVRVLYNCLFRHLEAVIRPLPYTIIQCFLSNFEYCIVHIVFLNDGLVALRICKDIARILT